MKVIQWREMKPGFVLSMLIDCALTNQQLCCRIQPTDCQFPSSCLFPAIVKNLDFLPLSRSPTRPFPLPRRKNNRHAQSHFTAHILIFSIKPNQIGVQPGNGNHRTTKDYEIYNIEQCKRQIMDLAKQYVWNQDNIIKGSANTPGGWLLKPHYWRGRMIIQSF